MDEKIQFTRNYSDLSTEQGFQFEFYCDRCGNGFRTQFKPSMTGKVTNVMDTANSLLGGIFGKAADLSERVRSAGWETAHDGAFTQAMEELRPDFVQCPRCSSWVCRRSCWNQKRGLCKSCAPDLGVEMSAAQASKGVDAVWESAEASAEDQQQVAQGWKETILASCPKCGASLAGRVKFCPECGANLQARTECGKCGAKLTPGVKFCSECGTPV
jgi:ribosomal protein S27AE